MNGHIDLSDLEHDDRDTATALLAAFEGVRLNRRSPVGSHTDDAHTEALLEQASAGIRRDRPVPTRPASRWRGRVWLAGAAAAVVALVLTVTLSTGRSSVAWAAEPTTPTRVDQDAAATACGARLAGGLGDLGSSGSASALGADPASTPDGGPMVPESLPALAVLDIRGDGALAVYQDTTWQVTCLLAREGGTWVEQGISVGPGPANTTPRATFSSRTSWVDGDSVSYLGGAVPPGTAKVTFSLSDGTTVRASVLGTTFAAWFPGDRIYVPGSLAIYDANGAAIG